MAKIASSIDARAPEFAANRAAMAALVGDLRALLARNALGGSEAARNKHLEAGKLLVRERVDALLDPGSPFLELSALAASGMYDNDSPSAGILTGIGVVEGQHWYVMKIEKNGVSNAADFRGKKWVCLIGLQKRVGVVL